MIILVLINSHVINSSSYFLQLQEVLFMKLLVTLYERLNLKRDCTAMYMRAQLHMWWASYTFKTEIVCYRPCS